MAKIFIAMSHTPTQEQLSDFKGEVVISEEYKTHCSNDLAPTLSSDDVELLASVLVNEALVKGCTHFAVNGEPYLVFHCWNMAKEAGLVVVQSTTKRVSVDTVLA